MSGDHVSAFATARPGVVGVDARLSRFAFPAHSHDHVCIGLMLDGAKTSRYGLRRHTVEAGDLVLVNPGEVHDGHPADRGVRVYTMLEVEIGALARLCRDSLGRDALEFERPVLRDPVARGAVLRWIAALRGGDALAERDAAAAFLGALPWRRDRAAGAAATRDLAARVAARLREAGPGTDTLGDLALAIGASRYQLIRAFRRVFGLTPEAFRRQLRVERARALLAGPDGLARIACDAGFADQSHMTREFRRLVGLTPAAYRAAFR